MVTEQAEFWAASEGPIFEKNKISKTLIHPSNHWIVKYELYFDVNL